MNCMFNENNPSDRPGIMKVIRPGMSPLYAYTYLPYIDDNSRLEYLRRRCQYPLRHTKFSHRNLEFDCINVFPNQIKDWAYSGKVPEGWLVSEETPFLKEYYRILAKTATLAVVI